eukprot:scaffold12536_cov19-Prasinocladus_malaysianus.AAC.1
MKASLLCVEWLAPTIVIGYSNACLLFVIQSVWGTNQSTANGISANLGSQPDLRQCFGPHFLKLALTHADK